MHLHLKDTFLQMTLTIWFTFHFFMCHGACDLCNCCSDMLGNYYRAEQSSGKWNAIKIFALYICIHVCLFVWLFVLICVLSSFLIHILYIYSVCVYVFAYVFVYLYWLENGLKFGWLTQLVDVNMLDHPCNFSFYRNNYARSLLILTLIRILFIFICLFVCIPKHSYSGLCFVSFDMNMLFVSIMSSLVSRMHFCFN